MGSCESRLDNCVPLDERIVLDAKAPPRAYLLVVDDPFKGHPVQGRQSFQKVIDICRFKKLYTHNIL